jgi:hypothetical protein
MATAPVIPSRLWRNDVFTAANVVLTLVMTMFAPVYHVPVFVQGISPDQITDDAVNGRSERDESERREPRPDRTWK